MKLGIELVETIQNAERCPYCGKAHPTLEHVWDAKSDPKRTIGKIPKWWFGYQCKSCSGVVSISCIAIPLSASTKLLVDGVFPNTWSPSEVIPDFVTRFLTQAHETLSSPDASVLMSASSIDAMLKDKGLEKGSLYSRIDEAVSQGFITKNMAKWAHLVRLDSNKPRHADITDKALGSEDAKRSLDFAKALAELLYILPSRIPSDQSTD